MAHEKPWTSKGMKKDEWFAAEVAEAVNAGQPLSCETVDFSDSDRPLTCIEVDFPIIPINQIASLEAASGAAKKPIYKMSKWWARRQSSVFRSMLLASSIKAPDEPSDAAKLVWDAYYRNHQSLDNFSHLKVADVFMGGGTTVIEGARLGMKMFGNDLNPVAWSVVKNELAKVAKADIEDLLEDIENDVKPQIMPFYAADCPRGHKGEWSVAATGEVLGDDFDPYSIAPEDRSNYAYRGPEVIYTFWSKHGPCRMSGCNHRTPVLTNPTVAIKSLTVRYWPHECKSCGHSYDIEEHEARLAPQAQLVISETEHSFATAKLSKMNSEPESACCPACSRTESFGKLGKGKRKKVELCVLIHPDWVAGNSGTDSNGGEYGGRASDGPAETTRWYRARATKCKLIEYRGKLPSQFVDPVTNQIVNTGNGGGTKIGQKKFSCGSCGAPNDFLESLQDSSTTGPIAPYCVQVYCPSCLSEGQLNGGRSFMAVDDPHTICCAEEEWHRRKDNDLFGYWPQSEIPYGERTHIKDPLHKHGFTKWTHFFNSRQLLVHSTLLRKLASESRTEIAEYVLGAFQQYLRLNNLFSIWHQRNNQISAALSNNNFNPKSNACEPSVFGPVGDGSWRSAIKTLTAALDWREAPTELVVNSALVEHHPHLAGLVSGKSERTNCGDAVICDQVIACGSSTELSAHKPETFDLAVTDPPFGGILQYAELSDFFYVWLRLILEDKYPNEFGGEYAPKAIEAVGNTARHSDPNEFYEKVMTGCWKEIHRILKPGGLLTFTFHHSEDAAWVSVLRSLFDAGFFLQGTYPIRSDESKGAKAEFGSKKIEYDIIHVCRKRQEEPKPISWAKLRRQVLGDVRDLQELLEHHHKEGLPEADLQVIRRGKALEYFSRHYGKVYKDQDTPITVLEALVGISQLLEEEASGIQQPPPHIAEPFTRMLLRLFDSTNSLPRDQLQKFLRGTGSAPSDYIDRGWTSEKKKVFYLTPAIEIAQNWIGKQRRGMISDYDQAMFLIGACFEGSGINVSDTLNNENFQPHPALGAILIWFKTHGADSATRNAAIRAHQLYQMWESKNQSKVRQLSLFESLGEEGA